MKIKCFIVFVLCISQLVLSQDKIDYDQLNKYFKESHKLAEKNKKLWGKPINGALLLIEPDSRKVYANVADPKGELKKNEYGVFEGIWPKDQLIANTSVTWNDQNWAMVMLPLPENKYDAISLIIHESFHMHQSALGFNFQEKENKHLDTREGRTYLRLELEALKKAILSSNPSQRKIHLTNAFVFRKYRYFLCDNSSESENGLELNEGLAEYTGETICGRPEKEKQQHFISNIDRFFKNPTFVRSFAYQTIPAYGYLLDKSNKGWNREVTNQTDLTDFLIEKFKIEMPEYLEKAVSDIQFEYNFKNIFEEESQREKIIFKKIAEYKAKFVQGDRLEISLQNMKIQFDPRNVFSLEGYGSVYGTGKIIDNWGSLTVEKGMLLSSNWKKITVSKPESDTQSQAISGDGWVLELNSGYRLIKSNNVYSVVKKTSD